MDLLSDKNQIKNIIFIISILIVMYLYADIDEFKKYEKNMDSINIDTIRLDSTLIQNNIQYKLGYKAGKTKAQKIYNEKSCIEKSAFYNLINSKKIAVPYNKNRKRNEIYRKGFEEGFRREYAKLKNKISLIYILDLFLSLVVIYFLFEGLIFALLYTILTILF